MTAMGMEEASPRSAIRKMGILSLRERTSWMRAWARPWSLSSPSVQSTSTAWMAESETITERPSSADAASTTSMARPCSSSTSARTARPSAVGAESSSSTTTARRLIRLMLRWIIRCLSCPARGRNGGRARRASIGQRGQPEEGERVLAGLSAPARVDVPRLARPVEPAERAIHQQAEVLVSARDRQRQRLAGEEAVEDDQVRRRGAAPGGVEQEGAVAEEDAGAAVQHGLQAGVVAGHGGNGGV